MEMFLKLLEKVIFAEYLLLKVTAVANFESDHLMHTVGSGKRTEGGLQDPICREGVLSGFPLVLVTT